MFCTKCGTKNDDTARFCTSCGAPIGSSPEVALAPAVPARLRRIRSQKKIAGVCAGFAEYFDMDLTLVRLIWLVLAITPPSVGVIAYLVAWIVLPSE